jgi:hypothetical protein
MDDPALAVSALFFAAGALDPFNMPRREIWSGVWASMVRSAESGDETSARFVRQFRGFTSSEEEAAFFLWVVCEGGVRAAERGLGMC